MLVAYTVWSLGNPPSSTWNGADRAVERGMDLFVDNKFLTTFACLFGIGIVQQSGVMIGRARLIERIAARPPLARRILFVAVFVAVATRWGLDGLPSAWTTSDRSLARSVSLNALYQANSFALAAAYAAVIMLISTTVTGTRLLSPLRAIGRMAFTNYLLQGLIIVPICLAFGLFDRVSPMRGVWIALALALIQVAFSTWWLTHREMGPFEQLWRTFTYHTNGLSSAMPVQARRIGE